MQQDQKAAGIAKMWEGIKAAAATGAEAVEPVLAGAARRSHRGGGPARGRAVRTG